ncbi:MAG TPA: hypothetical protein VLD55_06600 [Candidatus Sulfobium mesophilum]|nr:hypothetical protein [Candidatus Sulfobium mesophilum]
MTAKRAGEIPEVYHGTVSVTLKDDQSPLVEADQAYGEVITKYSALVLSCYRESTCNAVE